MRAAAIAKPALITAPPQKSPSENAPQKSARREVAVHSTDDKVPCPTCGLKVTRREGYGKVHKTGADAGRRKQKWRCLNPECDRFQKNFLGDWAD